MSDGLPYDPIQGQGQGHGGLKVAKMADLKVFSLPTSIYAIKKINDEL